MTLQRIALAMIVRNESQRLMQCLESVKDVVDEIIIVDTGSSDDTMLIAKQYTTKCYSYHWNDDFAAARNYAIQQTTCDWILSLDADEQLHMEPGDLRSLIDQSEYSAFCLPLYALKAVNDHHEADRFMVLRLFQRRYSFKGAVHEYVSIEDPTKVGYALHPVIYHTAVPSAERHTRRGRNIGLLKQALAQNPTSPYLQYYLGTEWLGVGRADLAISAFQQALLYFSPEQVVFRSPAVHHLISSYQSAGKLDEAICLCLQESQQYPEYCDLFFAGGILFELRNQYEIAIKWFQAAAKSTLPPLPFFHTDGTNSYLAYYHLGYCAEKLGLSTEAQKYYEQALKTNKNYYYPLYQLVLLKLTHQNALEVLSFLKEGNYLVIPQVAEKMAELFCTAGFPDVGIQCLGSRISSPVANVELAIRCQLYSGEISLALQSITQLRQDGLQPTTIVAVDEIIALLMSKRFDEGRQRMLDFWQRKNKRDAFRAVFCLYKKLRHGTLLPLSNLDSATTLFELQDRCLHVRAKSFHEQQCFATLLAAIRSILAHDEQTVTLLLHNLQEKEQVTIQQLDYTFTALRGLYR